MVSKSTTATISDATAATSSGNPASTTKPSPVKQQKSSHVHKKKWKATVAQSRKRDGEEGDVTKQPKPRAERESPISSVVTNGEAKNHHGHHLKKENLEALAPPSEHAARGAQTVASESDKKHEGKEYKHRSKHNQRKWHKRQNYEAASQVTGDNAVNDQHRAGRDDGVAVVESNVGEKKSTKRGNWHKKNSKSKFKSASCTENKDCSVPVPEPSSPFGDAPNCADVVPKLCEAETVRSAVSTESSARQKNSFLERDSSTTSPRSVADGFIQEREETAVSQSKTVAEKPGHNADKEGRECDDENLPIAARQPGRSAAKGNNPTKKHFYKNYGPRRQKNWSNSKGGQTKHKQQEQRGPHGSDGRQSEEKLNLPFRKDLREDVKSAEHSNNRREKERGQEDEKSTKETSGEATEREHNCSPRACAHADVLGSEVDESGELISATDPAIQNAVDHTVPGAAAANSEHSVTTNAAGAAILDRISCKGMPQTENESLVLGRHRSGSSSSSSLAVSCAEATATTQTSVTTATIPSPVAYAPPAQGGAVAGDVGGFDCSNPNRYSQLQPLHPMVYYGRDYYGMIPYEQYGLVPMTASAAPAMTPGDQLPGICSDENVPPSSLLVGQQYQHPVLSTSTPTEVPPVQPQNFSGTVFFNQQSYPQQEVGTTYFYEPGGYRYYVDAATSTQDDSINNEEQQHSSDAGTSSPTDGSPATVWNVDAPAFEPGTKTTRH